MRTKLISGILAVSVLAIMLTAASSPAEELVVKSCTELMRMAASCRDDVRTVTTLLGSATDAGDLDRIRNYKLKRATAKKQLEAVIKALEIKGCTGGGNQ